VRNTLSCVHLYCGGVFDCFREQNNKQVNGHPDFYSVAETSLRGARNKAIWIRVSRSETSNPPVKRLFTFAEGFSHLTLDVGVRLPGRLPIAANKRFG
jgi:hypothetical protein